MITVVLQIDIAYDSDMYYCKILTFFTTGLCYTTKFFTSKGNITLTLVLLRGVVTVFALVLKIAQPRGKIAPGTFKFILSLHFSEKIPNLPPTPG